MKADRKKIYERKQREKLWHDSLSAEDAIVAYLHEFDPAVAFANACSLERTLAMRWEPEQEEMRRRRDPRKVMPISKTRVSELDLAIASLSPSVHPDPADERHLLQLLKGLPPDRAWRVSHLVVRYQAAKFRMSQLPQSECPDESIQTAVQIPDAVRRAAARAEALYAGRET